ncbi:MAG: hypothetical protein ABJC04_07515, partial [Verrucomicrobiota bacterium]
DDTLNTDFSMQEWNPAASNQLAETTLEFLRKRTFKKPGRLDLALPPVYSVIQSSKAITVIFVSSADGVFSGTTFDRELNEIRAFYSNDSQSHPPLITVLVGRKGRPVTYSVNALEGPIFFPNAPVPAAQFAARPKTNSFSATNPVVIAPPSRVVPNIILGKAKPIEAPVKISEPESADKIQKTNQVEIPLNVAEPTNAKSVAVLSPISPPRKPEEKPATNSTVIVETNTNRIEPTTTPKTVVETPAVPGEVPTVASTGKSPVMTRPSPILAETVIPQKKGRPLKVYLLSGAGVVLVFLAIAVWFNFARRKPHSSLISHSMRNRPK